MIECIPDNINKPRHRILKKIINLSYPLALLYIRMIFMIFLLLVNFERRNNWVKCQLSSWADKELIVILRV